MPDAAIKISGELIEFHYSKTVLVIVGHSLELVQIHHEVNDLSDWTTQNIDKLTCAVNLAKTIKYPGLGLQDLLCRYNLSPRGHENWRLLPGLWQHKQLNYTFTHAITDGDRVISMDFDGNLIHVRRENIVEITQPREPRPEKPKTEKVSKPKKSTLPGSLADLI